MICFFNDAALKYKYQIIPLAERIMKTKITIITVDFAYAEALGKYLTHNAMELEVSVIDGAVIDNNKVEIKTDLLIVDDESIEKSSSIMVNSGRRVILTENREIAIQNSNYLYDEDFQVSADDYQKWNCIFIYKYNNAPTILRDLRFILSNLSGQARIGKKQTNTAIVGFSGGGSATGKTTICISVARDISKRYKKRILYLNYECFPSTTAYFPNEPGSKRSISQYLYYLFKNKPVAGMLSTEGFLIHDDYKVSAFYPNDGLNELKTLDRSELEIVLENLSRNDAFDYIFIDFSADWSSESQFMLESCHFRFTICDTSRSNIIKNDEFIGYFSGLAGIEKSESFKQIINKKYTSECASMDFQIELDEESFYESNGSIVITLGGTFGNGIQLIADALFRDIKMNLFIRRVQNEEREQHA